MTVHLVEVCVVQKLDKVVLLFFITAKLTTHAKSGGKESRRLETAIKGYRFNPHTSFWPIHSKNEPPPVIQKAIACCDHREHPPRFIVSDAVCGFSKANFLREGARDNKPKSRKQRSRT